MALIVFQLTQVRQLTDGSVHAEVWVNGEGLWILEVAARSIGGLCGRVLTHFLSMSLEELILRQVLAEPLAVAREGGAAGVMMSRLHFDIRPEYPAMEAPAAERT